MKRIEHVIEWFAHCEFDLISNIDVPSVKRPVNFNELNGSLTAARRVIDIDAIVAIDVRPNTPPQTE
jgi:hypothetical protein